MKYLNSVLIGISTLIIALSVGYYFVLFQPAREEKQLKIDQEKIELEKQKADAETATRTSGYLKQTQMDDCIKEVKERFANASKQNGNLSGENAKLVFDLYNKEQQNCIDRYK